MRKPVFLTTAIVGLAMSLTACGSGSASGGSSGGGGKTISVGASVSLTGTYAGDGQYAKEGYEYAVAQLNKQGGLLGKKLNLTILDDQSDPGTAVKLYTKLITQNNVDLLLGPYSSDISQAVVPLVDKFQKPTIFTEASAPTIFKGSKYAVQGQVSSLNYFSPLAAIVKQQGYKTAAEITQNTIATQQICQGATATLQQAGVKVVYSKDYPKGTTDFSSLVIGAKQANPDIVMGCGYLPDDEGIAQAMNQQGLKPKLFAEPIGPVEPAYLKSLGSVANGVITSTAWWPTLKTPGNAAFISGYTKMFGHPPDYHAADSYTGTMVLAQAIKQVGSLNDAKINQVLHTQHFQTIMGSWYVNSTGQQEGLKPYLLQWQQGALKLIAPASAAETKVKLPYQG